MCAVCGVGVAAYPGVLCAHLPCAQLNVSNICMRSVVIMIFIVFFEEFAPKKYLF